MPGTDNPDYRGTFMNRGEKLQTCFEFDEDLHIPLCIDHADCTDPNAQVPEELIIGYITGMGVDHEDNHIVTGFVYKERPEMGDIFRDMLLPPKKFWGLSSYTKFLFENERRDSIQPGSKKITHVGVTLNPALGEEGSMIFDYGTNPDKVYGVLRDRDIQGRALLASGTSLDRWGVAPNVKQHVLSVLEKNISDPTGRPNVAALPPQPIYQEQGGTGTSYSDALWNATNEANEMSAPTGEQQQKAAATGNGAKPNDEKQEDEEDNMEVDSTGSPQQQSQPPANSKKQAPPPQKQQQQQDQALTNEELADGLIKGLNQVLEKAKAAGNDLDKHDLLMDGHDAFLTELRKKNIHLEDLPIEVDDLKTEIRNNMMDIRNNWASVAKKIGNESNQFNKDWQEKLRSNGTLPSDRRQLASFVQAAKANVDEAENRSQKDYEAKLQALKKENDDKLAAQKRKFEEQAESMKADSERLKRRGVEVQALHRAGASGDPNTRGIYAPSFLPSSSPKQQQQQQQRSVAPPRQQQSSSSSSLPDNIFTYGKQQQQPQQQRQQQQQRPEEDAMDIDEPPSYGTMGDDGYFDGNSFSIIRGGSEDKKQGNNKQFVMEDGDRYTTLQFGSGTQQGGREGFVTATGFKPGAGHNVRDTSLEGATWASKYILPPQDTSFQRGMSNQGLDQRVFTNTLDYLSAALSREDGKTAMVFTPAIYKDGEAPRFAAEPDYVTQGVSAATYDQLVMANAVR